MPEKQTGWLSPQAKNVTVTTNQAGDSGYRGGTRYANTARNYLVEAENEKLKKLQEFDRKIQERENEPPTSEIAPDGTPRVIGMSGRDPLLGTIVDFYLGDKVFKGVGQGTMHILLHPRWYRNAAVDVVTRPISTAKAVKNGLYIHDFKSLMRNARSARKELEHGIKSTNMEYNKLTGLDIEEVKLHLKPWKHFKDMGMPSDGYYGNGNIYSGVTIRPNSNIRHTTSSLRFTGGHEQTHYAEDALSDYFNTPRLFITTGKDWRTMVPNPNNPVAKKYESGFLKGNLHGRDPEETWANYMGYKAAGWNNKSYYRGNEIMEGIKPKITKQFIQDYKQYLTDTYK